MKIFLTTLTSFLFLSCVALAKKPNFVYIMVDDAGYGDFSCFGQKKFKTPNVDRMAKEGMKLTDFYSSSTVCARVCCWRSLWQEELRRSSFWRC